MKHVAAILLLLCALNVSAATQYILRSASGSQDGSDWNNAFTNFQSILTDGNTYYLGDGLYSSRSIAATNVNIYKATTNDHGTATGWSDAFALQAVITNNLTLSGYLITIDGRTGGGPAYPNGSGLWTNSSGSYSSFCGSRTQSFGIRISSGTPSSLFNVIGVPTNIVARHVECLGAGDDGDSGSTDGINTSYGTNLVFEFFYINNVGRCPVFTRAHQFTFANSYVGRYESTSGDHSEGMSMGNLNAGSAITNIWITNNIFGHFEGTGVVVANADSVIIANNIFAPLTADSESMQAVITSWDAGSQMTRWQIYNNLFIGGATAFFNNGTAVKSGNVLSNNFFHESYISPWSLNQGAHDFNVYGDIAGDFTGSYAEANCQTNSHNLALFFNYATKDLRLATNTAAGAATAFTRDMLGTTRASNSRGPLTLYSPDASNPALPPVINLGNLRIVPR